VLNHLLDHMRIWRSHHLFSLILKCYYRMHDFAPFQVGAPDFNYRVSAVLYPSQLRLGNHVFMRTGAGVMHHCIVWRVDRTHRPVRVFVVHFWGETYQPADATVRTSKLVNVLDMTRDGCLMRADYDHFTSNRIAARARYLIATRPAYNLLENNCEHVCTWLRTGHARSLQADHYVWSGGVAIMNIALAVVMPPTFPQFVD
jgi:hypothetical protein